MSLPFMPLYIADYLADTGHLTAAEHGGYLLLIMHYWCKGGLPNDDRQLARIARMSDREWTKVRATIADFFDDDQWRHYRIDAELSHANEKSEARAEAGRRGGRAAAKSRNSNQQKDSNAAANVQHLPHTTYSEVSTSGAEAPTTPIYSDSKHELWGEGIPILESLGVKNPRPIIGRWLKDAKDDAQLVLGAIQRARDARVIDAVPWITRAIQTGHGNGTFQAKSNKSTLSDTFREIRSEMGISEDRGDAGSVARTDEKGAYEGLRYIDGGRTRTISAGDFGIRDGPEDGDSKKVG